MKLSKFLIFTAIFLFQVSITKAETQDKKGFYLGLSPLGLSYFQSLNDPTEQSFGYGLNLQLGGHFHERVSIYGQIESMLFVVSGDSDEGSLPSILFDIGPAVKYRFLKDKNWFLTGGLGISLPGLGADSQVGAQHGLFFSSGIGYDFRIKKRAFVAPELSLKFYPNQNTDHPFAFSTRGGVDQALQSKFTLHFGWYF